MVLVNIISIGIGSNEYRFSMTIDDNQWTGADKLSSIATEAQLNIECAVNAVYTEFLFYRRHKPNLSRPIQFSFVVQNQSFIWVKMIKFI